jgi:hypothetical protein
MRPVRYTLYLRRSSSLFTEGAGASPSINLKVMPGPERRKPHRVVAGDIDPYG